MGARLSPQFLLLLSCVRTSFPFLLSSFDHHADVIYCIIVVSTSVILAESRTKLYRSLRDEDQYMRAIKTDVLLQFEAVKIFTAESYESDRLRNALRVYQKGYWNVYSSWNSLSLIQDSISAFGLLVCSFILANRVVKGEMQVGEFVTFTSYLGQLYRPLNSIAGLYRTVMSNLVDTEQLMELLSQEMEIVDRPGASELLMEEPSKASIEFDNVRFSCTFFIIFYVSHQELTPFSA